jgi:beta-lactamase class D
MKNHLIALPLLLLCNTANLQAKPVCTLISNVQNASFIKQEGNCDEQVTPASTFKLALSLMGFDSGYLVDETLPALPFHEGYVARLDSWKATTNPRYWIENSVVWFSQQITEWLGKDRFQHYVSAFQYGNQDLSGDSGKNNGLTRAWLSSSLKISPKEQINFLNRLIKRELPVSPHAFELTERISLVTTLANGWEVHGKTGSGQVTIAEGTQADTGWFIGWAKKDAKAITFAYRIVDEQKESTFPGARAKAAFLELLPDILNNLK